MKRVPCFVFTTLISLILIPAMSAHAQAPRMTTSLPGLTKFASPQKATFPNYASMSLILQDRPSARPCEQVSLALVRRITRHDEHLRRQRHARPQRPGDHCHACLSQCPQQRFPLSVDAHRGGGTTSLHRGEEAPLRASSVFLLCDLQRLMLFLVS